ncbi:hypothetical protein PHMEG_00012179 [Phytophthora megakarya]|uniref:Uncharacterized protein n=1 Tax=Phytophthora megakarya TaxID=4795 RepID=A0A225W9E6_9STRA|nr:hypothetical protein PHMEG_00012179 [Phytophthora megakarya]
MDSTLAGRYEEHQLLTCSKRSGISLLRPRAFFRWHVHMLAGSFGLIHSRDTKLLCLFGSSKPAFVLFG